MILSELILKRMPMDALAWLAPNVLEGVNEQGDCRFDDLAGFDFCQTFLNQHYKRDSILELVGKEFEAEKKSKPDRLSDVMKIVQKRHDLKYNKKKLEPKATIEFDSTDPVVRFAGSYLFTGKKCKPKGLDLQAARSNLLLFNINRENDDRLPKFQLVDYSPLDRRHHPDRHAFRPVHQSAFNPAAGGIFLDSVVLGQSFMDRVFRVHSVTTDVLEDKKVMLEDETFEDMEFNYSRQRCWRDYVTNPEESLHPMIQRPQYDPDLANSPEEAEKAVIDFYRFSGDKQEVAWSFDFSLLKDKYDDIYARFIDEGQWFIVASSEDESLPTKVYHCDLQKKEVNQFSFPENEDSMNYNFSMRFFGIYKGLIYYSRVVEVSDEEWGSHDRFLFGYLKKESRKRHFDADECDDALNVNLCFLEYRSDTQLHVEVKIGANGFVHFALVPPKVYTFSIEDIKKKIPKAEKRSRKIDQNDTEEITLPCINLQDFCIPKYRDLSENLLPWQSDVGYVEGKKFHLLV
ncbi:Oidioi.mRNA.OKI2018_I69.chr1.g1882.t1.cds [Oikopleura dioica]|uniref:Oidioi.mRNA.OKI2018_I69.chr1.g1882.t1.cds n=1 Tax=Oikopleura dioica TaxID=34765 RepID=A0ABN7SPB4_OIKDI|nr:Oidioi.mRNA.OKI2018_I69.chr1.g1882.t1.cds [Oikopleura dioica]